jgi:putative copper export protein/mono/diheme cytochrome c family protein
MTEAATVMVLMRSLHLAAMVSLLGTVAFLTWMLPAAASASVHLRVRLVRLWWMSGALAVLAGGAWFALQAASIAGAADATEVLAALAPVAWHTRFGTMLMLRLALLLLATCAGLAQALIARRDRATGVRWSVPRYLALLVTAIALGLQGCIGHAGATGGATGDGLVLSEALHLLAAGLWLGALLPLAISLRSLPPALAASVCERFSPVGLGCVVILAGTGLAQGLELIGSVPALVGTAYGRIALLKIALFLLALMLAAVNRLWLADRLATTANGLANGTPNGAPSGTPSGARRHLLISISAETVIGLAIIIAAAFLASTVPGVHQTPVWPFRWQFSLVTVQQEPAFRQEVLASLLMIGAAAVGLVAALLRRRFRLPALIVLAALAVWRGPSFSLLTIEAFPTSFQRSPTGFSAASIVRGRALFMRDCAGCHGPEGGGAGPAAAGLRIKPADLTQPHLWDHSDGELFWWLTHGIDDPEGGLAMPGFASSLTEIDRWALIDYLHAHNAAATIRQGPAFPVRAPVIATDCNGVAASTMADLHGHAVLIVLGETAKDRRTVPPRDAITVMVRQAGAATARSAAGSCTAADTAAWSAYAMLAGLPLDKAAGSEFLVDPDGWLRAVQRPGATDGWHSTDDLLAALRGICTHPIEQQGGGSHEHHH